MRSYKVLLKNNRNPVFLLKSLTFVLFDLGLLRIIEFCLKKEKRPETGRFSEISWKNYR